jgi:hypothetical protein
MKNKKIIREKNHRNRVLQATVGLALSALLMHSTGAATLAAASGDLTTGQLCFPVTLGANNPAYDVCLRLLSSSPQLQFELSSALPAQSALAAVPTYSQQEGLHIPLLRLSDGSVYADARMTVAIDTSTSAFIFTLQSIRRLDLEHDVTNESVARLWNEALLDSIRSDLARPTVHARNLFHTSIAMYDAWSVFDATASRYLLGRTVNGYNCPFTGFPRVADVAKERAAAISYAVYRILAQRFAASPGAATARRIHDDLMLILGHDTAVISRDYSNGSGAALGNHIADCVIAYGLQDGANEANGYAPLTYMPVNPPLAVAEVGNAAMTDPDRWQPLAFEQFVDQSGNVFVGATPPFVTPEWGRVSPFALRHADLRKFSRDGAEWWVYHDPGAPARLGEASEASAYKWSHQMVALWSSHLDPSDGVLWDISPAGLGNSAELPATLAQQRQFYDALGGGDGSKGRELNPVTGQPYVSQLVPRGDYTRVLAQYWADGPRSETPPGHWFTIFNRVAEHPLLEKRYRGVGPVLDDLEWDVKGYFLMGGTVHDAAITAWGIKGWYDTSRPVSVLRRMAERGQSSNRTAANYDPDGFELVPGYIESVQAGDPLAGTGNQQVGKIKLYAWRGTPYIEDPEMDTAGVGWILAENWWPFQTRTFVTPPFGGYISGHSTFSRAAAVVMTAFTGSEYFPGGMSEIAIPKDEYLEAERGPSMDIVLQWATYQDASDQTSLSRIWGGIHPPMDDIAGRRIGTEVGKDAFDMADDYFAGRVP